MTNASKPLPIHSQGRLGHRRSYSDTRNYPGPGTLAALSIPRRIFNQPSQPVFHIGTRNDDDQDSASSDSSCATTPDTDEDDSDDKSLKLRSNNSFNLSLTTDLDFSDAIPFPRSCSLSPPLSISPASLTPSPSPPSPRPRTSSTPILLSNGKPLKSSLKSFPSSPNIASSLPTTNHTRAHSAPASPFSPKNVHFPSKEEGGLETIRLFNRTGKPASLSLSPSSRSRSRSPSTTRFPFPYFPPTPTRKYYELDTDISSPVPAADLPPSANVHLESLSLSGESSSSSSSQQTLALTGTLLVRNVAYEKTVAVRFTLDEWHTTCEVAAWHVESLPALPGGIFHPGSGLLDTSTPSPSPTSPSNDDPPSNPNSNASPPTEDSTNPVWDRFKFTISLNDYFPTLERRTMWLVASVSVGGGRGVEWWDNNGGRNYRVGFQVGLGEGGRKRKTAVSAPSALFPEPPPITPSSLIPSLHPPPTPNSAHNFALSKTTFSRLGKLDLKKNYAAPVTATAVILASVNTTAVEEDEKEKHPKIHVEGWEFEMAKRAGVDLDSVPASGGGVKLYSLLGLSSTSTASGEVRGPEPATLPEDVVEEVKPEVDLSTMKPITTSITSTPTPALSLALHVPLRHSRHSSLDSPPTSPSHSVSPQHSPRISPRGFPRPVVESIPEEFEFEFRSGFGVDVDVNGNEHPSLTATSSTLLESHEQANPPSPSLDPDLVYQSFVKNWCFAEGPTRSRSGGIELQSGGIGGRRKRESHGVAEI